MEQSRLIQVQVEQTDTFAGWTAVHRSVTIDHDLENFPFQIKTDSVDESYEEARMGLYTIRTQKVGEIVVSFSSSPQYYLSDCAPYTNLPTALPTETDKIWTISLSRSSGIRLTIHCNNKEVLNFVFSDNTCSESNWSEKWSRDVEKIWFPDYDTASDYYRPGN